jgi:hypothetical protein
MNAKQRTLTSSRPSRTFLTTSSVTRWQPFARLESVNVVCQPIVFLSLRELIGPLACSECGDGLWILDNDIKLKTVVKR